jgi:hypothetical protein
MIPETGTPDKVTQEYLVSAGFKSTNDRAIIPLLKFLGLVEQNGTPTADYRLLRDRSQFGAILASHIRSAYGELFSLFPDANERSSDKLRDFFATKTDAGGKALGLIVNTFKTLCESADFGAPAPKVADEPEQPGKPGGTGGKVSRPTEPMISIPGVTINLNIQLQLPATENASIYDSIFKSLKENLIDRKPATSDS